MINICHPSALWLCRCCRCTVKKTWAPRWSRTTLVGSSIPVRGPSTKRPNATDILIGNLVCFSFSSGRPTGVVGGISRRHIRVQRRTGLLVQLIAKQGTACSVKSLQHHCWPSTWRSAMLPRVVEFHANYFGRLGSYIAQDLAQRYIQTTFSTITKPSHTGMCRKLTVLYLILTLWWTL